MSAIIRSGASGAHRRRVALTIFDAADSLAEMPYKARKGRRSKTRELVISNLPFVIIYRVSEPVIEIVRILHGAQKWP